MISRLPKEFQIFVQNYEQLIRNINYEQEHIRNINYEQHIRNIKVLFIFYKPKNAKWHNFFRKFGAYVFQPSYIQDYILYCPLDPHIQQCLKTSAIYN